MDPQEAGSKKRRRTEADETGLDGVTKDIEVWLADGNIVVVACNIAFRVHRSVLSLHSEVFRDLFLLPPPPAGQETWDGCPVVRVPDAPDNLRHLFLVLCCGKNYYSENDEFTPVPILVLYSLVVMGHKYAIPTVLNDALARLKKYYTSDLAAWEDEARRARHVTARPLHSLLAIEVARLTNTPSMLPSAFLAMCDYSLYLIETLPKALPELTADVTVKVVRGRAQLATAATTRILAIACSVPSQQCDDYDSCSIAAHEALCDRKRSGEMTSKHTSNAALQPLCQWFWKDHWDGLCDSCRTASSLLDEETRRNVWKALPHLFDLELEANDWPV